MTQTVRIKITSTNLKKLEQVCREIKEIAERTGTHIAGPIHLPVRRLIISTRKSPCGEGTKTWRKHQMRVHRRLIDLGVTDQRVMRQIMRIQIPDDVAIEMQLQSV